MKIKLIPSMMLVMSSLAHAQVAINPSGAQPDPSAMLDVSSTNSGVLVPRMTQAQMEAIGAPGVPPPGLLVFNTSANAFCFFNGSEWQELRTAIADGDTSDTNELQTLTRSGTDITLSNGGGTVSIADLDNDPANELQDLGISSDGTDRSLTITGGTGVTFSVADNDSDPANEIQVLSRNGTDITLSLGGGTVSVADNDNDPANELQTLSSSASGLNRTVSISGGNQVTFSVADNDNDPTNELDSQWLRNGSAIYNKNGGNVGIGVTTPVQKLDVNGRLRIRSDSPIAGDVLTAMNSDGDAQWGTIGLHHTTVNIAAEKSRNEGSGWWGMPDLNTSLDGLSVGDRVLILVDFRCSLKGSGSGSDDYSFRVKAGLSNSSPIVTGETTSSPTGWIETIDQHRDHWHHVSFQRTVTMASSGTGYFSLQVDWGDSDDTLYVQDFTMTVIAL